MWLKRIAALLLAGAVTFTSLPVEAAQAYSQKDDEITADADMEEESEALEDEALFLSDEEADFESLGAEIDEDSVVFDEVIDDEIAVDEESDSAVFG